MSGADKLLVGRNNLELIFFDIMKEEVSFHQPLLRFIAGKYTAAFNIINLSLFLLN